MSTRLVLLTPLFIAATAHAQAPGDYYSGEGYAGPSATAPQTLVAPAPAVFQPRWSIAVSAGSLTLAPDDNPDASKEFGIGQLAVRYKGWPHLELELALAGGNESVEEGAPEGGNLKVAHVTFAARYRFNAERHWNWWLMAGIGSTTVAPEDASSDYAEMQQRPHGLLGVGLEYRWTRFAIQAEAKAMAVGPTEEEQQYADDTGMDPQGISGGSFTLGGAYYF